MQQKKSTGFAQLDISEKIYTWGDDHAHSL